jgi:uncharacterized membrane protein
VTIFVDNFFNFLGVDVVLGDVFNIVVVPFCVEFLKLHLGKVPHGILKRKFFVLRENISKVQECRRANRNLHNKEQR